MASRNAASAGASLGAPARLQRDARGRPLHLQLGGLRLTPEAEAARELHARYDRPRAG